ncbi:hypothetical protein F5Y03DRAFT_401894 [Xylaria venustula]|nr:hypothetical protein F5Y03DRAFT_401894 [Xylaria venustula]
MVERLIILFAVPSLSAGFATAAVDAAAAMKGDYFNECYRRYLIWRDGRSLGPKRGGETRVSGPGDEMTRLTRI